MTSEWSVNDPSTFRAIYGLPPSNSVLALLAVAAKALWANTQTNFPMEFKRGATSITPCDDFKEAVHMLKTGEVFQRWREMDEALLHPARQVEYALYTAVIAESLDPLCVRVSTELNCSGKRLNTLVQVNYATK